MEKRKFSIVKPFEEGLYVEGVLRSALLSLSVQPLPALPFDLFFVQTGVDVMCDDVGNVVAHLSVAPLRSPILLLHAISLRCFPEDVSVCTFWGSSEKVDGLTAHSWLKKSPCDEGPVLEQVPGDYVPGDYFITCYKAKRA